MSTDSVDVSIELRIPLADRWTVPVISIRTVNLEHVPARVNMLDSPRFPERMHAWWLLCRLINPLNLMALRRKLVLFGRYGEEKIRHGLPYSMSWSVSAAVATRLRQALGIAVEYNFGNAEFNSQPANYDEFNCEDGPCCTM